jgi:hypothetical protein
MAEGPRKTTAQDEPDGSVLAGLPATRPNRMGRRARGEAAATRPRAAKAKAKAKPAAKAKPKARATAKPKAKATAKPAAKTTPKPVPTPIGEPRRPRPVRAGHPGLDATSTERPAETDGAGLAGNVAQAAAAGVKLGGRVLKGIAGRLSKQP